MNQIQSTPCSEIIQCKLKERTKNYSKKTLKAVSESRMSVIIILLFLQNIETHKLNHTDLEPRYLGTEGHPASYDTSVTAFYHINYCQPREACKKQFREEFMCRCTNKKVCVSPGLYYDAFCQIEIMGVVWVQPKIIEYHGKIIILSPSSPHHNEIDLITFGGNKGSRRWEKRRQRKKKR